MKPVALFAGLTLAVIALTAFAIAAAYGSPEASRAVWTSAAVAFAVQVMAFAIIKLSAKTNVMAGWGVGAILRFVVLGVYALGSGFARSMGSIGIPTYCGSVMTGPSCPPPARRGASPRAWRGRRPRG